MNDSKSGRIMNGKFVHDEKSNKLRKAHANSVLKEVKNKNNIEQIDQERRYNFYNYQQDMIALMGYSQTPRNDDSINQPNKTKSKFSKIRKSSRPSYVVSKQNNPKLPTVPTKNSNNNTLKSPSIFHKTDKEKLSCQRKTVKPNKNKLIEFQLQKGRNTFDPKNKNIDEKQQEEATKADEKKVTEGIKDYINSNIGRRSSKLELQLDEIVKYSKMYPGSKTSKFIIDHNTIQKLLKEQFKDQIRLVKGSPSNNLNQIPSKCEIRLSMDDLDKMSSEGNEEDGEEINRVVNFEKDNENCLHLSKETGQNLKDKSIIQDFQEEAKSSQSIEKKFDKEKKMTKKELLLNMVNQTQDFTIPKIKERYENEKKLRSLIAQSKAIYGKGKKKYPHFQLPTFIEAEIQTLKARKQRNEAQLIMHTRKTAKNNTKTCSYGHKSRQTIGNPSQKFLLNPSSFQRLPFEAEGFANIIVTPPEQSFEELISMRRKSKMLVDRRSSRKLTRLGIKGTGSVSKRRISRSSSIRSIWAMSQLIIKQAEKGGERAKSRNSRTIDELNNLLEPSRFKNTERVLPENCQTSYKNRRESWKDVEEESRFLVNNVDMREQKILDIHRFFQGGDLSEEQFSDYVSRNQIEAFKSKFSIYNSICTKIKQDLYSALGNRDSKNANGLLKLNEKQMDRLTMKTAVYLHHALGESNSLERKKMLQELASKMHLVT